MKCMNDPKSQLLKKRSEYEQEYNDLVKRKMENVGRGKEHDNQALEEQCDILEKKTDDINKALMKLQ